MKRELDREASDGANFLKGKGLTVEERMTRQQSKANFKHIRHSTSMAGFNNATRKTTGKKNKEPEEELQDNFAAKKHERHAS